MSWNALFGTLKALKVMTREEIRLWCQNKGYITFDTYKSGRANYAKPLGFVEEQNEANKDV